jgi:phosphopantetheinyl transferase (holo-ACP synthase)
MIGNDIVDLKLAAKESTWNRPRLHSKLFSKNEQEYLRLSENPEQLFWLFWTMKEAAYKAHQRRFLLPRKFNPKSFRCKLHPSESAESSGIVQVENCHYSTAAKFSENAIHCVASVENSAVKQQIFSASKNLKEELKCALAAHYKLSPEALKIEKNLHFIPHLILGGKQSNLPFSISHHGNYSAYVIAVN